MCCNRGIDIINRIDIILCKCTHVDIDINTCMILYALLTQLLIKRASNCEHVKKELKCQ